MKNLFFIILVNLLLLLASCSENKQNSTTPSTPFSQPKTVKLNIEEGYSINPITGDSIEPIILNNGDTLLTGVPIPAVGKVINPDSVARPVTFKVGTPRVVNAHPNVHKIPENLTIIPINHDSLKMVFLEDISEDDTTHYIINSRNKKVKTGVPIPAQGKTVTTIHPESVKAMLPRLKDNAIVNLSYLSEDQGLINKNVYSILEDKTGNLWFGTLKGASKYNGEYFTHFTKKEGLIGSVTSMLEDSKGNLWFGTSGGVSKYDGDSFTHFTEKEGFNGNYVNTMFEDSNGNLWFGTIKGGVSRYNGESFTHFTKKEGLINNCVYSILEDKDGNFWFGTVEGVSKYNGESFTHYTKKDGLLNNIVASIFEDTGGNLWFGIIGGGVSRYNGKSFTSFTEKEGLSANVVYSMLEDKNGNIWFATRGGVNMYDGESFTHFTENEGLPNNFAYSMLEDSNGNLWFGTIGGGVSKYNPESFTYLKKKEGLIDNDIISIYQDKNEYIWLGTTEGVSKYNGESFTNFTMKEGLCFNNVKSMLEDNDGDLWFGTFSGVSKYDGESFTKFSEKEGLCNDQIISIIKDMNGNLWFCTQGGVSKYNGEFFTNFTEKDGLSGNVIYSSLEDKDGNLWFGTSRGVSKYDGESFTNYSTKEGLIHNLVRSILEDKDGNLWFGNLFGVSKYDGESFTHYTEKEGLSGRPVYSILEDKNGNLWFATMGGGVSRYDGEFFMNFTEKDGLSNNSVFKSFEDKNKNLWLCTIGGGVSRYNGVDLSKYASAQKKPIVHLMHLDINGEFIDYRNRANSILTFSEVKPFENYPLDLKLAYNQNHLTFHFSAIDLIAPHKIQYSFKLEGLNNKWSKPGKATQADFRQIPYGDYTFKVRAIGLSREWSEPIEYSFTISPPWWHSWWARGLYLLMGLGLILGYIRWRTNSLEKQKVILEQTVKDRTIELEAQKERAEQSERVKEEFLANMSHEIRTPMHAISGMVKILKRNEHPSTQDVFLNAMHTSSDNLVVILNDVLDLSKIEAGKLDIENIPMRPTAVIENVTQILKYKAEEKGLQLSFQIDKEVPDLIMGDPTRLNQILINLAGNAIKFTEKGNVNILLQKENDRLKFSIKDTGIGIPKEKVETIFGAFEQAKDSTTRNYGGTGLGLSISKQLVELQQGKIWVESEEGKGSTFFVELPLVAAASNAVSENLITEDKLKTMAASLQGIRIFLAEDNAFNQMIAQDDLSFFIKDVQIDVVENGALAVEKFQQGNYDLILMDVQMPEMNGFEATRKIREIEKNEAREKGIPIIAMTASLLKSEIDSCRKAGMDNYIPKPYKPEELIIPIFSELNKN